jgi:hypothetical protein
MEQNMVLISREQVDHMIRMMGRAEYYCAHAISTFSDDYDEEHDDPTRTYPGASGYAGATLRDVIQTLESHIE